MITPTVFRNLDRNRQVAKLAWKYGTHSFIGRIHIRASSERKTGKETGKMFLAEENVAAEDPMALVA